MLGTKIRHFVYTQEENTYKLHFSKVKTAVILHFSKVKIAIILHFSKILHVFGNEYPEPKGTPQRETCVQGTPRRGNEHIAQGSRRRSERIAELAPAIPSEEEEDEVSALGMMKR